MTKLTRRQILAGAGALLAANGVRAHVAHAATDQRLIVVILRGALDGLAAAPPYADPDYRAQRGALALADPGRADGALDLDGRFGLHPALGPLHALYRAGEMLVVHATATPYRDRSHFDAQDLLENGTSRPRGAKDGWLNRALAVMGGDRRLGLAVGQTVPLILRGATAVGSWAPAGLLELDADFLLRLAALYGRDPVLGPAIAEGLRSQAISDDVLGTGSGRIGAMGTGRGPLSLARVVEPVAKLLAAPGGARVAVLEVGGWDTHANQGALGGRLANQFRILADGLAPLKPALGPAWRQTAVLCITEFGRTVAINGTGGTDHGTGGVALLLGGGVNGGRVIAEWPGLATRDLLDGRDLAPTTDTRALLKGVLAQHLGLSSDAIERTVLPDSRAVAPLRDLVRV